MGLFQKAVKHDAKLRLAIAGPSGSGKTYSALAIATALGGPIAFVDTEHGSASKYADLFDFDVMEIEAPYHPDRYIEAIEGAAQAGYKVIILDSLSHAWNGPGGLLELVEDAAKRMKTANTYAAWRDITPIQNRLIEAIVSADIHLIGTMRSKQDYVQEKTEKGNTVIRKVGMAPIQRDGFEYEFDVFFDMDHDNNALVSKTRCPAMSGKVYSKPGAQVAKILKDWLKSDVPAKPPTQNAPEPTQQATATIEGNSTPANPFDDNYAPDDAEAELLDSWKSPADAHAWAVAISACENIFEAQNSFKNLVNEKFGGKCTKTNIASVHLAYMRKQEAKLEELFQREQTEPAKVAA